MILPLPPTHAPGRRRLFSALSSLSVAAAVCLIFSTTATAQDQPTRFEAAAVYSTYDAPNYLKSTQFAYGGRFTWNCLSHLALEGEYGSSLKSPIDADVLEGGYFSQALFGIKSGMRWRKWGLFGKFRPGFIRYSSAITGATTTSTSITFTRGPLKDAAFDLGGGAEFFLSRRFLFRYDAGEMIIHEGPSTYVLNGVAASNPSFTAWNHFETEVSVAFRF